MGRSRAGVEFDPTPWPKCLSWKPPREGESVDQWQAGRCGGCGLSLPGLLLDHDHGSGLVRGHLCPRCNAMTEVDTPRWRMWRDGWNPAAMIGHAERYWGWNEPPPLAPVDEDEKRDAINLLSA